jgi:hypothetical protein
MSVSKAVSVSFPDNSPTLAIVGSPPEYNPYVGAGYLRPWYVGVESQAGDGSGGTVTFSWSMRPVGNESLFVTISQIRVRTSDTTDPQYITLYQDGDDWEHEPYTKRRLDVAATYIPLDVITQDNPLNAGAAKSGTTGDLALKFETNTNAKTYLIDVRGWVADRPFLTPLTVSP